MSRALDDLVPAFKPKALELLARCTEAGIQVQIICTGRTQAEQDEAVRTGHSWVKHSKHQDGLAIYICPFDQWQLHGPDKLRWDTTDPVWAQLGTIGERLGLRWGGHFKDFGHFELTGETK